MMKRIATHAALTLANLPAATTRQVLHHPRITRVAVLAYAAFAFSLLTCGFVVIITAGIANLVR